MMTWTFEIQTLWDNQVAFLEADVKKLKNKKKKESLVSCIKNLSNQKWDDVIKKFLSYCMFLNRYHSMKSMSSTTYKFIWVEKPSKCLDFNKVSEKLLSIENELFYLQDKDVELWDDIVIKSVSKNQLDIITKLAFAQKFEEL